MCSAALNDASAKENEKGPSAVPNINLVRVFIQLYWALPNNKDIAPDPEPDSETEEREESAALTDPVQVGDIPLADDCSGNLEAMGRLPEEDEKSRTTQGGGKRA